MQPIANSITASLAQIQNLTVYNSPNAANGDGSVSRMLKLGPDVLFQSFQALKNTGMLPLIIGVLEKSGLDLSTVPGLAEAVNGKGGYQDAEPELNITAVPEKRNADVRR